MCIKLPSFEANAPKYPLSRVNREMRKFVRKNTAVIIRMRLHQLRVGNRGPCSRFSGSPRRTLMWSHIVAVLCSTSTPRNENNRFEEYRSPYIIRTGCSYAVRTAHRSTAMLVCLQSANIRSVYAQFVCLKRTYFYIFSQHPVDG